MASILSSTAFIPFLTRKTLKTLKSILLRSFLKPFIMSSSPPIPNQEPPPPPVDPSKPSTPISYPIKLLQDLESRSYFDSFHYPFNVSSVTLPATSVDLPRRRRILVCHDMMGGYVDDRWIQGGSNSGAYTIWHWHLMDVFVYFSHNLVSLPPPCWTNAAHTHGVKVLGTFITEWKEGEEICKTLLSTKESARLYAERLAELAVALQFDGWLINTEVNLGTQQVANLKEFVSHLTQTVHSSIPGSLIIWYDSVTKDGELEYQNQLNEKNKPFFDLCDGILANYTWKVHYPKDSAVAAGDRRFDVYMGIDVFGRGTYGGGEWNTSVALDLLKKDDISAAIFAPGWVYENLPKEDFQRNQNRWWGLVEKSWGILQNYPTVLPFYSNFDQGHGFHFFFKSLQAADGPWNNISCQGFQPVLDIYPNQTAMQVFINFEDVPYSGGGNITCQGSLKDNEIFLTRLFHGKLPLDDQPLHFSYSVKSDEDSLFGLCLELSSNTNDQVALLLADDVVYVDKLMNKFQKVIYAQVKKASGEVTAGENWVLNEASIAMSGYILTEISMFCCMRVPLKEEQNLENNRIVTRGSSAYRASLGDISIHNSSHNMEFPPADSWFVDAQDISWATGINGTRTVSLSIIWKLESWPVQPFTRYNIFMEKLTELANVNQSSSLADGKEFVGVARVQRFFVSDLEVSFGIRIIKFIVQVCGSDGTSQELDQSPTYLLVVEG